ncbi:unnamed protein product [Sphagnum troendelagicum]
MTSRTPQSEVFWPLLSNSKHSGVLEDSKSPTLGSLRMVVKKQVGGMRRSTGVVCAFGDVSAEGTNYLIAGAVAIAIVGTALPILFSRKDLCPECDGAGFVRKPGTKLNANAARKDLTQIVCKRCNGLGKIGFLQHNMFDLQPHSQWDITGLKNG